MTIVNDDLVETDKIESMLKDIQIGIANMTETIEVDIRDGRHGKSTNLLDHYDKKMILVYLEKLTHAVLFLMGKYVYSGNVGRFCNYPDCNILSRSVWTILAEFGAVADWEYSSHSGMDVEYRDEKNQMYLIIEKRIIY